MVTWITIAGACLLTLLGEALHVRRLRRVARLAFGPAGRPAAWVHAVPISRVVAVGLIAWGLLTLLDLTPKVHHQGGGTQEADRHLLLVLDVSPSMRLEDAGPTGEQSRTHRARDLLTSMFERIDVGRYKISVIATYNGARPVVVDTKDHEVVHNVLTDLPMQFAFKAGKTDLLAGLEAAAKTAKTWEKDSTLLLLVSDGDTVPATGMPAMPPSIDQVLVVGVGDPIAGTFIDGKQSRQDSSTLRQIAVRLGGTFHDGNLHQIPTATLRSLTAGKDESPLERLTKREYALIAVACGSTWLALLPLLLALAGTRWRPGVEIRRHPEKMAETMPGAVHGAPS